ncbi:MAG TPA: sugar kinase [Desulfobacterales bacterium]|nr:sugar kinase [Desulfobacterales bacterium]
MLVLVGTIPIRDLPLLVGQAEVTEEGLFIDGQVLDVNRGTAAMMSAACVFCDQYGLQRPLCVTAGDIGARDGSIKIYEYLVKNLPRMDTDVDVLTFHYIMPDIKRNKKVLEKIDCMKKRPILIADAGSMYAAKGGGDAKRYDIFTPDVGELAFLADDKAVHPTYTRGFIHHLENDVPQLIDKAFKAGNSPRTLFVKGQVDYICSEGTIVEEITGPRIEELEPIGGTGDTVTGMTSGLVYRGDLPIQACLIASRANRRAGELCKPSPASQVKDIIQYIPEALKGLA